MIKKIILAILISIILISNTQAMSNYPSTLILEGNTSEWINGTIHFSDVPTPTLTGYEKWTSDGKTLNRSLSAKDVGIELVYPKVVNVENGTADVNVSVRTNECGKFIGAIFYRTEGQTGIAAGTWIKINVTEKPITLSANREQNETVDKGGFLSHIWSVFGKFWDWITGFFPFAEASNITMNTSVSVIPTSTQSPSGGGGGGGGGTSKDTDGDGIDDISEMITGSDYKDPCDPNPNCAACLVTKPSPTPKITPIPTEIPAVVTEKQPPIPLQSVVIPHTEPEKKPSLLFYGFCIALVGAGVAFLIYKLRKRALEEGEEEVIEGEVYWK